MNNDDLPRSSWYDRPQSAQIMPQQSPQASRSTPDPARTPLQRKSRTGLKIAMISLCVLLLVAASVWVFSDSFGKGWSFRREVIPSGGSFSFEIPGANESAPPAQSSDELPETDYSEDYRDFFSKYYSTERRSSQNEASAIARAETGSDFRIELCSAEGQEELTLRELYTECFDSVVGVKATVRGRMGYYWGTGIIMSEDGFILTNQHIVSGTDNASIILPDGTEHDALLVGEDTSMDIAVLKIEASGLKPAVFGNSGELRVGDSVAAIGNPLTDSLSGTMTNGIISAIDRYVSTNGNPMMLLQTNAALNEGNSGGPLFNMYGQVVGITNMKMSNPVSDVSVEGLGFAIPSATVKAVTDQLIAGGKYVRPGIGITVGAILAEDAEHYDLPNGLYISSVSETSDAAAKGVKAGDILTHVNGIPVRKTDDVMAIRDTMHIGETMRLTIFRDGETFDVEIELYDLSKLY